MAKTKAATKRKTTKKASTKKVAKKTTTAKKKSSTAKKSTAKKSTAKRSNAKKTSAKKTTKKKTSASKKPTKKKKTTKRTKETRTPDDEVTIDRRREERRGESEIVAGDNSTSAAQARAKPERRKKVPRRRQIDPTTCERDYNDDEIEFMHALDEYKRANGRMFPTCSEILEVVRNLGYAKIEKTESQPTPPDPSTAPGPDASIEAASETAEANVGGDGGQTDPFGHVPGFSTPPENDALGLPITDLSSDFTDVGGTHSF